MRRAGDGVANRPNVVAVLGVTGSGKSTWIKRRFLYPPPERLLVWDYSPVDEYAAHANIAPKLGDLIRAAYTCHRRGLTFQLVFKPSVKSREFLEREFSVICNLAMELGNLTLLVEELKYVTQPHRAPDAWARVVMTGRKVGLTVIGTSQRPAHIDKDFLGNATVIHTGRLMYPEDISATAKAMCCDQARIRALNMLDWLESDERRELTSGSLTF